MKNKFRERSIRASLFPYVEKLLETGGVDYSYDGNGHLTTSLTSKMYHRYIERGMCAQNMENGPHCIPYVSLDMYRDGERPKGGAFFILKKDRRRFLKEIAQVA